MNQSSNQDKLISMLLQQSSQPETTNLAVTDINKLLEELND